MTRSDVGASDLLTPEDAAPQLGLSLRALHEIVTAGRIRHILLPAAPNSPRFTEQDLEHFLDKREATATGFVYVVGSRRRVKVGYTTNPASRFSSIQTGFPENLLVHAILRGSVQDEREMHLALSRERTRGEWFMLSPRTRAFIAGLRRKLPQERVVQLCLGASR